MPAIDNLMVFRCVQVVRRLSTKNREVGLFCNISRLDAGERASVPGDHRIPAKPTACSRPIWCSSSRRARCARMGPIEQESLAALADLGFRFSMDQVTDLRIEPRELAERGFRFVKVPAALLLSRAAAPQRRHPSGGFLRSARPLRHRPDRRADRERGHGGRSARLRRALRPGLPVLAAAPGARRGAAGRRRARRPSVPHRRCADAPERPAPAARGSEPRELAPAGPRKRPRIAQLARGIVRRAHGLSAARAGSSKRSARAQGSP